MLIGKETPLVRQLLNTYLNSSLREFGSLRKFFPSINVRVVCPLKSSFQLLQLLCCEGCPATTLLSF